MYDLLEYEACDVRAAEAVALFCYQVKKWIGSFSAASRVPVRVIHTDEERMIAKTVCRILGLG
jgi:acetate kinase